MRRLLGIWIGLMAGFVAFAGTMTTGAQQTPPLRCSPTTVDANGPSFELTCSVENFPPNTPVTFTRGPTLPGGGQATTDGAGRASFAERIPTHGVCAPLSGDVTVSASGGGVEASTTIVVIPSAEPPVSCGPGAVPALPRLTG
jgi:hypothetical protein